MNVQAIAKAFDVGVREALKLLTRARPDPTSLAKAGQAVRAAAQRIVREAAKGKVK
jgi:hypothetical protein